MLFFAALFPQFIDSAEFWTQFAILSATYLAIDGAFLSVYGGASHWIASHLAGPARVWLDRLAGTSLILAALVLGMKKVTTR